MSSRNVVESVDPMSAFVDMSEELTEVEETEESKVEVVNISTSETKEETSPVGDAVEPVTEIAPEPVNVAPAPQEDKKVNVLDMLHDTTMTPKAAALEKNALPLKLQNELAEKPIAPQEAPNVGTLYDLLEVARQYAVSYQKTWDDSIRAYARHMGFPAMASLQNCKAFLIKWGAKIKD